MATDTVPLLIIGAGPYGLSMAAYCRHVGLEYRLLGEPMDFWQSHMPRGMFLRSRSDWHLDPLEERTLEHYRRLKNLGAGRGEPIPIGLYLDYAQWFQKECQIVADRRLVERLSHGARAGFPFEAVLDDGRSIAARHVVVTTGFGACAHLPDELLQILPEGRVWHTQDYVELERLAGKSCLIVGGRQSAFEWAALAREHGAAQVHISHRRATPAFALADWSWVNAFLDATQSDPGCYRKLPATIKNAVLQHMWTIGRLQLEPWLAPRVNVDGITLWPQSNVVGCRQTASGSLDVQLDVGSSVSVDVVLLATGYRVDVRRLRFLARGNLLPRLAIADGYPVLGDRFDSSVPGLFFSNRFASRDFGHFFDFTAGTRVAARLIAQALVGRYAAATHVA
jgi:lysine/ornithine N-monooxygenase